MDWLFDLIFRTFSARLINASPGMSRRGDIMIAKSNWRQQFWTLASSSRTVEIDPKLRIVHIFDRRFWLYRRSRRIEFDWIAAVTFGYTNMSPGLLVRQEYDLYKVGLRLKNSDQVHLFSFFGEGDFVNDWIWPDFFYWHEMLLADWNRGDQTRLSEAYSDVLSKMIGVAVVDPTD
jgi:hypothetical protein